MKFLVGVATWNRCALLSDTLDSVSRLRTPAGVEWDVVVCNNNSTDGTAALLERQSSVRLTPLFEPKQGKSHALNRIIQVAREREADWLLFTDDDVCLDSGWLEAYRAGIDRYPEAVCLGGTIEPQLTCQPTSRDAFFLEKFPHVQSCLRIDRDHRMLPLLPYGPNLALRVSHIPSSGFDPRKGILGTHVIRGEETDVVRKMLSGGEGWMLAAAKVKHVVPRERLGVRWFCQWHAGDGERRRVDWSRSGRSPRLGGLGLAVRLARDGLRAFTAGVRSDRERFYLALSSACRWYGFLRAHRAAVRSSQ